ncbi:MAG: hypothetical protein V1761_03460 [bacterium]
MKRRELKNLIKTAAFAAMPDVLSRIDLQTAVIAEAPTRRQRPALRFGLAGVLKVAMVSLVAVFSGILLYNQFREETPVLALETEAEVYGFTMVSATSILSQFSLIDPLSSDLSDLGTVIALADPGNNPTTQESPGPGSNPTTQDNPGPTTDSPTTTNPTTTTTDATATEALVAAQVETVTRYLNAMEIMLAEKTETEYQIVASDTAGYQWLLTYSTVDLLGNTLQYEIRYNETVDPENANRHQIVGIMTFGDVEYALSGSAVIDGETIRTTFRAELDADNYVTVADETDADGQKYRYTLVQNGETTQNVTMRLKREDQKLVATLAWSTAAETAEFRFQKKSTGGLEIRYRYLAGSEEETGTMEVNVEYDQDRETYCYQYAIEAQTGNHMGHSEYSGDRSNKTGMNGHHSGMMGSTGTF